MAAATVGLAGVGRGAHDSTLDFQNESNGRVNNEGGVYDRNNNTTRHRTCIICNCDTSVDIVGEYGQIKDNHGTKHAEVVLEGGNELEDVNTNDNRIETGNDASSNGEIAPTGHDFVIINLDPVRHGDSNADSNENQDYQDCRVDETDKGHDNDGAAVIAAAAAYEKKRRKSDNARRMLSFYAMELVCRFENDW